MTDNTNNLPIDPESVANEYQYENISKNINLFL